jgi:hypoxanthine phosphoribosyltransferase
MNLEQIENTKETAEYREVVLLNILQIKNIVDVLAKTLQEKIKNVTQEDVLVVGILKGALFFTVDLLKALNKDYDYGFVSASSYLGEKSTSMVSVDLKGIHVKGKTVILVDEICDTGCTLTAVVTKLLHQKAKSVYTCVLLDKPSRREIKTVPDFVGATIPNLFVIGYGLDEDGAKRCLPYIYYKEPIVSTNKEAHETAAGMALDPMFFVLNNIDPDGTFEPDQLHLPFTKVSKQISREVFGVNPGQNLSGNW